MVEWAKAHFYFEYPVPECLVPEMATDLEHVRSIVQRVAESAGLELVDVELRGGGKHRMLRLVIDRAPGAGAEMSGRGRPGYTDSRGHTDAGAGGSESTAQKVGVGHGVSQGGVTHEDCAAVSREVSAILDVEDAVPGGSYTLEVSSPGLDRRLVRPADYERFTGSRVKLMTREPIEGNRHFEGRLESFREGRLVLELGRQREKREKGRGRFPTLSPQKQGRKGGAPPGGGRQEAVENAGESSASTRVEIELANVERANLVPEI